MRAHTHLIAGAVAIIAAVAPFAATQAQAPVATTRSQADVQRDRASILAMAGDYKVRFDFRETASFVEGYKPLEAKVTGGYEAVRVVEDVPGRIVLQHLLVADAGGETIVIKHWRQDWVYQPAKVLTYQSLGRWTYKPVPAAQRAGAWSQTVWQTDDSPRYGGVGRWDYSDGVARWTSDNTARPLARRDAVRKPPYDHYMGVNRHALTPNGWVHEQDNAKVGVKDGETVTFAHEAVINSYTRSKDFKVALADAYWAKTKPYWAQVRTAWDQAIERQGGIAVTEEAQNGSVTGPKLMGLADDIAEGKTTTDKAVAEARAVIADNRRLAAS